ncbi:MULTISPECIES: J domain-containing protein [unclassified Nocardioides]|uniref:J domain-containing protein n=1 Tax=unclassified Nocardioides TaxID=2615069 RepID=UPI0009E9E0A3
MDRRRTEAFEVLGIPVDSDADAVAHAYRRLARVTHPDVSAEPEAAARFAALAAAYRLASQVDAVTEGSASARRPGMRYPGSAYGREPGYGDPTSDWARGWGSVPQWPIALWPNRSGRPRPGVPIVAGPVFISPARRPGNGEVRGG